MFTIRFSQEGSVIKWDRNTFAGCRPCEADGNANTVCELVESSMDVKSMLLTDSSSSNNLLIEEIFGRMDEVEWTSVEKANDEAERLCRAALDWAMSRTESYDLIYARAMYNEYKEEGRLDDYPQIQLDEAEENGENPIGFGDEDVTESNCFKREDGTVSYNVHTIHIADPFGAELFNVVKLNTTVEVVASDKSDSGQKRKRDAEEERCIEI